MANLCFLIRCFVDYIRSYYNFLNLAIQANVPVSRLEDVIMCATSATPPFRYVISPWSHQFMILNKICSSKISHHLRLWIEVFWEYLTLKEGHIDPAAVACLKRNGIRLPFTSWGNTLEII
jgi:hypothetical protein